MDMDDRRFCVFAFDDVEDGVPLLARLRFAAYIADVLLLCKFVKWLVPAFTDDSRTESSYIYP